MEQQKIASKQFFLTIRIIHFALIVGQLIFAGIFIFLVNNSYSPVIAEFDDVFLILTLLITFGALFGANAFYKSKLNAVLPEKTVIEKLQDYRVALIVKYGILEGAGFFSLVAYFITANHLLLIFPAVIIVAFLLNKPSTNSFIVDFDLSAAEKSEIQD